MSFLNDLVARDVENKLQSSLPGEDAAENVVMKPVTAELEEELVKIIFAFRVFVFSQVDFGFQRGVQTRG